VATEAAPGFFGKVPAVGDFVSRRLPRDFLDPWDQWLQVAIVSSREVLAEAWLDYYLSSPIWRFALSADVAGPLPSSGVLMPSVDAAGRYFPFTLATFLPAEVNLFQLAGGSQAWYEASETVALSVLADAPPTIDSLDEQVSALGLLAESTTLLPDNAVTDTIGADHRAWHLTMPSGNAVADALLAMTKRLTELRFESYSLWWSSGSVEMEPAFLMCEGLPPASGFAAMLGGDWRQSGWGEIPVFSSKDESV